MDIDKIKQSLETLTGNRVTSELIAVLANEGTMTAKEIEKKTELRQPEVSIGMKELNREGWIRIEERKGTGKGRPQKLFSLKVSLRQIVSEIQERFKQEEEVRKKLVLDILSESGKNKELEVGI